ncbi:MAG: 50S ribosomal protein L19 [Spirochaetales bacterium]|nr:50S ribosomal protein L19 [Spirochaetales bacterium]
MDALKSVESKQLKEDVQAFKPGDTLRVHFKIVEGANERVQVFEGLCISRNNSGMAASFTVRKISYGVGVERIFPLHSPRVQKIEVVRRGRVRRAKLYYVRNRVGKAAKVAELLTKKHKEDTES